MGVDLPEDAVVVPSLDVDSDLPPSVAEAPCMPKPVKECTQPRGGQAFKLWLIAQGYKYTYAARFNAQEERDRIINLREQQASSVRQRANLFGDD